MTNFTWLRREVWAKEESFRRIDLWFCRYKKLCLTLTLTRARLRRNCHSIFAWQLLEQHSARVRDKVSLDSSSSKNAIELRTETSRNVGSSEIVAVLEKRIFFYFFFILVYRSETLVLFKHNKAGLGRHCWLLFIFYQEETLERILYVSYNLSLFLL